MILTQWLHVVASRQSRIFGVVSHSYLSKTPISFLPCRMLDVDVAYEVSWQIPPSELSLVLSPMHTEQQTIEVQNFILPLSSLQQFHSTAITL